MSTVVDAISSRITVMATAVGAAERGFSSPNARKLSMSVLISQGCWASASSLGLSNARVAFEPEGISNVQRALDERLSE
jgi:hypothetical protein